MIFSLGLQFFRRENTLLQKMVPHLSALDTLLLLALLRLESGVWVDDYRRARFPALLFTNYGVGRTRETR